MTQHTDVLIIGAGPTGLGAAQGLEHRGASWRLLESAEHAGGLAGSHVDAHGFTWDLGGHVQHSHYTSFDRAMDDAIGADGWITHERSASIWMRGRFVPYPFQLHLHHLDDSDCAIALDGLRDATALATRAAAAPAHFDDWLVRSFGTGLANLFMRPYNRKVWATRLDQLDYGWIGDRVAVPNVDTIARAVAARKDTPPWGPNRTFRYPRHGGTGAPWRAMATSLPDDRLAFGQRVIAVDADRHVVHTADARSWQYDTLISTMPLSALVTAIGRSHVPFDPDDLVFSSVDVVGVGVRGSLPAHLTGRCWMYFPEQTSPYFRVTVLSHYSPFNVPEPGAYWSLMAEVSRPSAVAPDPHLAAKVVSAMRQDRLLPEDADVVSIDHTSLRHGYPTPFLGRDRVVHPILAWLEARHIYSRGRFGAWKYEVSNQDHSYAQGRECVDRVLAGGDASMEPTLHTPAAVNGRQNP